MASEPRPEPEGQLELVQDVGTYEVDIDYAGNFIARPVPPLTRRPAPQTEPPSAWPQEPEPAGWPSPIPPADHPAEPISDRRQHEPPTPPPWPPGISKPEADKLFEVGYVAALGTVKSPAFSARTEQLIKVVGEAIIAQARAYGIRAFVGGELNPVVDAAIVAALAARGLVVAGEYIAHILMAEGDRPYVPARSFHGFEPPPPSPPLPGLVPPPSPQRKPGEGGFTPAPPTPPSPGFTPSPPSVPVHPGRPAEANKPIVVEAKKPAEGAAGGAAEASAITSGSGTLSGAVNRLDAVERAMADRLVAQGHNVVAVERGEKPTPDFIVDGQETELKTLSGTGPNTLKNAIQKAESQSKSQILIDARKILITEENALAQIRRAEGNVGSLKGRITILTQDGIISY
jgi:hypothetical protein